MSSCLYIAKTDASKSLPAKHFGYWSLRWSAESAQNSLTQLRAAPYGTIAGVQTSLARVYELKLLLTALHAGAHWAFAAAIPTLFRNLRTEDFSQTLEELKAGCDDATKELLLPNGNAVNIEISQFVSVLTGNFFQDLLVDLGDSAIRPKQALPPIPSRPAARFIKLLENNFQVKFEPVEIVVLGPVIDEIVQSTIRALDELFNVSMPA